MEHAVRRAAAIILSVTVLAGGVVPGLSQEEPIPVPFIERETVRFVFLDIVVEEKATDGAWAGWRLARDLKKEQVAVLAGGREMILDLFEDRCRPLEVIEESRPQESSVAEVAPPEDLSSSPDRYILYFDLELLDLSGRHAAFQAARNWAAENTGRSIEVMVVAGASGLRIIRPLSPLTDDLQEDLDAALEEVGSTELWAATEFFRVEELIEILRRKDSAAGLARSYAAIDRTKTRRSLQNLRELMSVFERIEGTKNLLLFADAIRFFPGEQYPGLDRRPSDIGTDLQQFGQAANERNVRIYPVQAGLEMGKKADSALTMLASETGGRHLYGTNFVDRIFDHIKDDLSCFYRVGFTATARYSGRTESLAVRVTGENRKYRVRHRSTLHDPTTEQIAADMVLAAFVDPSSARGFDMSVNAAELFNHAGVSHLRIEMSVPLAELLSLPVPGGRPGRRQFRVELGVRFVPLRSRPTMSRSAERGAWADVATDRESCGFGKQAVLTIPLPGAGRVQPTQLVLAHEIDAPPGSYRVVAVAYDQLAQSAAAVLTDVEVISSSPEALGAVALGIGKSGAVMLAGDEVATAGEGAATAPGEDRGPARQELAASCSIGAPSLMPPDVLLVEGESVDAGRPIYLSYALCHDIDDRGSFTRGLTCDSTPITLPPPSRLAAKPGHADPCTMLVEQVPPDLRPGAACRFEVVLERPGRPRETRTREFSILPVTEGVAAVRQR
jgi:VWFA-related protein